MFQRNLTTAEVQAVIAAEPTPDSEAMQGLEVWQCGECKRVYSAYRYAALGQPSNGCGCQGANEWPAQYSLTVTPGNFSE